MDTKQDPLSPFESLRREKLTKRLERIAGELKSEMLTEFGETFDPWPSVGGEYEGVVLSTADAERLIDVLRQRP